MSKYSRPPIQRYNDPTVTTQPIHSPTQPVYNGTGYSQNVDQLSANMASMSVYQTWNQMWSQESVNLMTEKDIRTKTILNERQKTGESQNGWDISCTKEIMRSTLTKVPDSASLLQKARLPFGILIHPFKTDEVRNY